MNPNPAHSRKHRSRSEISPPPATIFVKEQPLGLPGSAPVAGGIELGSHSVEGPAIPGTLPILPVRNSVIFPGMVVPLPVRRPSSRKLLEESLAHSKVIGIFTQKDPSKDDPAPDDLHRVGVAATVMKLIRGSEEQVVLVVQGLKRIAVSKVILTHPFLRAEVEVLDSTEPPTTQDKEFQAVVGGLRDSASKLLELAGDDTEQLRLAMLNIEPPGLLADFLAGTLNLDTRQKQDLLEELDVVKRVHAVYHCVTGQLEIAQLQQKIQKDVSSSFTDQQRRAYLREQVKAIQKELGEGEEGVEQPVAQLRKRLEEAVLPQAVLDQAESELRRLSNLHPASPEYSVVVTYVETIAELPWNKLTEDNLDLDRAQNLLDRDHFDLEKVKRRLIEYLAVRKLNPKGHGPILCFVGPRLASPKFSRSDLAAEYYDHLLFKGATFADLEPKSGRPFLSVNATDLGSGARFEFTQDEFDLLHSDLSRFPISRAVAASSAFPVYLTPIVLKNYSAEQSQPDPEWIQAIKQDPTSPSRLRYVASQAASYSDGHRHFIHLLDGGLSDNLGLRGALDRAIAREQSAQVPSVPWKLPRRVALIVVDAHTDKDYGWDSKEHALGLGALLGSVGQVAVSHYSFETIELFREVMARLSRERTDSGDFEPLQISTYVIDLHFNQLPDESERRFFNSVPTSLQLPSKTVDRQRQLAARQLADNVEFRRLVSDIRHHSIKSDSP